MIRRISVFLLLLLFLAGFFITCLPYINELVFQMHMKETVSDFQQVRNSQSSKSGLGLVDAKPVSEFVPSIYPELWKLGTNSGTGFASTSPRPDFED